MDFTIMAPGTRRCLMVSTATILVLAVLLLGPQAVGAAQGGDLGGSLRPYWHVFLAYASAWVLIFVWLLTIVRRLSRLESRPAADFASDAES